jgi:hypothetical protein
VTTACRAFSNVVCSSNDSASLSGALLIPVDMCQPAHNGVLLSMS